MNNITIMFLQFIVYSFIGYVLEVIYCSFLQKKVVNRGFLFGPICPIYGIGSVILIHSLKGIVNNPALVFLLGMIITSILEYYTSYIFEKIFNNKWWDYSYRADSINGRICLKNSLLFGLGTLIIIYIVNPFIDNMLLSIPRDIGNIICIILFIIVLCDFVWSVIIAYNLRSRLIIAEELKSAKLKLIFEKKNFEKLSKIKFKQNRLIKNYPNLAKDLRKELNDVRLMILDAKNVKKKKKNNKKSVKK